MPAEIASNPVVQDIVLSVIALAGSVITAILGLASRSLLRWLASKSHDASFNCAIQKMETLTINAVDEVEQTMVRQLKADKNWNQDTAKQARDTAVSIALRHLGDQGLREIQGCLGLQRDKIEGMLRTYVEKRVGSSGMKSPEAPVVPLGV